MELTARVTDRLDQFESDLPRLPANVVRLNRALVSLAERSVGTVAGAVGGSVSAVVSVGSQAVRTVTGQARRGALDTARSAEVGARTVAGQAGAQAERVAESVEHEANRLTRRAGDAADARPGSGVAYEDWSRAELYDRAQELDIEGRSGMSKAQLIRALRAA